MKRICVFCGSSSGSRPEYRAATEELGAELVRRKIGLVLSAPVKNGAIVAGSSRSQWSTRESPRSTETQ